MAPGPLGGEWRSGRVEAHAALILKLVESQPDLTLMDIPAELAGAGLSAARARSGASSNGIGSREKKTAHAAEQDRPDILRRRLCLVPAFGGAD